MAITALPPAPSRSDPTNFATKADAWVAAMSTFTTEANALQTDVNTKQSQAATSASDAATSASNAATSATSASNSATSAASAAGATLWVTGTNYSQYAVVRSPTTLLSYVARNSISPSNTDPATDTTNWKCLNYMLAVTVVASTSVNAVPGVNYVLTNGSLTTVTFPSTAQSGDEIWITVTNSLDTNLVARNGLTIMGLSEDHTLDAGNITYKFKYLNGSWRYV